MIINRKFLSLLGDKFIKNLLEPTKEPSFVKTLSSSWVRKSVMDGPES